MAHLLWNGIEDSTKGGTIVTEQTVAGLQGLPRPEEQTLDSGAGMRWTTTCI
jgi:hypothetical protein